MVSLQDLAYIALIVSVSVNVFFLLYGPWAKRRKEVRTARAKVVSGVRDAKVAASSSGLGHIGSPTAWSEEGHRLSRRIRREVEAFGSLCTEYWDAYLKAKTLVTLSIYQAVSKRPELERRLPSSHGPGGLDWIVKGPSGSRTSRDNLEDALIEALIDPILEGEKVSWTWLTDHESEFADGLGRVTTPEEVNSLLEDIRERVQRDARNVERPHRIKDAIRSFLFRTLPEANKY